MSPLVDSSPIHPSTLAALWGQLPHRANPGEITSEMPGPQQKIQQRARMSCFLTKDPPPNTTFSSLVIFMNSLKKKYHFWHTGHAAEELFLFHLLLHPLR